MIMTTSRTLTFSIAMLLGIAACGSAETGDVLPEPAAQEQPSDGADAGAGEPADAPAPDDGKQAGMIEIGRSNLGGPVVDPKPYPIDGFDILELFPERIAVRFTAGDPNCTAADAVVSGSDSVVVVELFVGITEDALAKSCVVGDVEQTITIALEEGLDGRGVTAVEPIEDAAEQPASAPLPGDGSIEAMAEAIIGLDVDTAERQVVDAGWAFRVSEIDGEPQMLTMDERDDRVNVTIVDGFVTAAKVF